VYADVTWGNAPCSDWSGLFELLPPPGANLTSNCCYGTLVTVGTLEIGYFLVLTSTTRVFSTTVKDLTAMTPQAVVRDKFRLLGMGADYITPYSFTHAGRFTTGSGASSCIRAFDVTAEDFSFDGPYCPGSNFQADITAG
jgi:hypothetical protein